MGNFRSFFDSQVFNPSFDLHQWLTRSATIGLLIWLGCFTLWWQRPADLLATIALLLLLAILVNTPLALSLIAGAETESSLYRVAIGLQPFAALAVTLAFHLPTGWMSTILVMPWLLFAVLLALSALQRLYQFQQYQFHHKTTPIWMRLAAMLYLPIGVAWLVAYHLGLQPLGFVGVMVLLTAVHFHFTGFAAIIWASVIGDVSARPIVLYPWLGGGFVIATPLIALGITLSPLIEIVGVLLLASCLVGLTICLYSKVLPELEHPVAKGLLACAPLAMLAAIAMAVIYGIGEYLNLQLLTIPQMVQWHGWLNAVGFLFAGLLGWRMVLRSKSQATSHLHNLAPHHGVTQFL